MIKTENPWENAYNKQGSLWAGHQHLLPEIEKGDRVLETGCGNGKTAVQLCSREIICHGMDISLSAIRMAAGACRKAEFYAGDITAIPAKDEVYDTVISFHTISHLNETERFKAASEIYRVLRNEGRFYFRDFGAGDLRCGKGVETERNTFRKGNGISTHFFDMAGVTELFRDFKPVDSGYIHWKMRVKGHEHQREEIHAVFLKE
ncbi:class I SAM-dependent methyltransferase [Methanoplanus limicola]|uniref:Methyltransferase type 11 n=1 Tax=Methanoplanus limicola DSM 2279 TaxID=937775 RepID=H1Z0L4_9EURY|nr:class I SAM-dependent methyltransferase [Methanoplanus limicola]EHQ35271.1 Methyltransferase type 11 [Methanoplanus limicola DSM 2279]